jgi:hypothetical protein
VCAEPVTLGAKSGHYPALLHHSIRDREYPELNVLASFDNLVGTSEDRNWDRKTERLGGLEIDDQLEGGRLLDRQIGWLLAPEDPSGVNAELAPRIGEARSIAIRPPAAANSRL